MIVWFRTVAVIGVKNHSCVDTKVCLAFKSIYRITINAIKFQQLLFTLHWNKVFIPCNLQLNVTLDLSMFTSHIRIRTCTHSSVHCVKSQDKMFMFHLQFYLFTLDFSTLLVFIRCFYTFFCVLLLLQLFKMLVKCFDCETRLPFNIIILFLFINYSW